MTSRESRIEVNGKPNGIVMSSPINQKSNALENWSASNRLMILGITLIVMAQFSIPVIANDNPAIRKLKEVQTAVSKVAAMNLNACVAVSDGTGFGSGVIVSEDGLVLTAGHVMAGSGPYQIILPSGRTVDAVPLGKNLNEDSGMIRITDPGKWPYVELDRTGKLTTGQWVVSLGHSGGFELGRNPPIRTGRILERKGTLLTTDAVLIGGDSGGPLFNLEGKLIAIHSSIGDTVVENRHVTTASFIRDWEKLKQGQKWGKLPDLNDPETHKRRGKIGIRLDLTKSFCLIKGIDQGMPAEDIGLEVGDIVKQFDNVIIMDGRHLIDVIKRKHAGDVCPIVIKRGEETFNYEILLR